MSLLNWLNVLYDVVIVETVMRRPRTSARWSWSSRDAGGIRWISVDESSRGKVGDSAGCFRCVIRRYPGGQRSRSSDVARRILSCGNGKNNNRIECRKTADNEGESAPELCRACALAVLSSNSAKRASGSSFDIDKSAAPKTTTRDGRPDSERERVVTIE